MNLLEFDRNMDKLENFPKQENVLDYQDVANYLKRNGWKFTGNGAYSDVYSHPNKNYIVKINHEYDRGFARFAFFTHEYPNKHFPVISNVKFIKGGDGDKFYVYIIEKLEPMDGSEGLDVDDLHYFIKYIRSNLRQWQEYIYEDWIEEQYPETMEYMKQHPSFWEAVQIISKYDRGSIDISQSNIMKRKDGTLVFSDPFTNG